MPNTLCHLGVQTLCSKAIFRDCDLKWIAVGCIVPDLPWIVQRILPKIITDINVYDLRLYAIIQASLFFCLLLAVVISLQVRPGNSLWRLLTLNVLLHLLLDSLETKWGNGVHLVAPWSWQLVNFGLFWPEDLVCHFLTLLGLGVFLFYGWRDCVKRVVLHGSSVRWTGSALLLLCYLVLPLFLLPGPLRANSHYIATLQDPLRGSGQPIAMDRVRYESRTHTILPFNGEIIQVRGPELPTRDGVISLRGFFSAPSTIELTAHHVHTQLRDFATHAGLVLTLLLWGLAFGKKSIKLEYSAQ